MDNYLQYNDPLIVTWRKGTVDDPFSSKTESLKVINDVIVLTEIPDFFNKVLITGYVEMLEDNFKGTLLANQFIVNYRNGIVTFASSEAGKTVVATYKGKGQIQYPASRIYAHMPDEPEITKNLQEILDNGSQAFGAIEELALKLDEIDDKLFDMDTLKTTLQGAETARAGSESTRVSQESSRVSAESARVTAESSRVTAEGARVSADSTRSTNETTRQSQETTRQTQEGTRQTNETSRTSAESARVTAEGARVTAETTRGTNETARQNSMNAFKLIEAYNPATAYVVLNKVTYQGSTYQCILNSTGNLPTNTTYWILVAQKGTDGAGAGTVTSVSGSSDITVANGTSTPSLSLSTTGVTAGSYAKVTVNAVGRVTAGTTLAVGDIPTLTLSKISDAGTAASKATGTASGNVPVLDGAGKLVIGVIPVSSILTNAVFTGTVTLSADGTSALHAVTKQQLDAAVATAKNYAP